MTLSSAMSAVAEFHLTEMNEASCDSEFSEDSETGQPQETHAGQPCSDAGEYITNPQVLESSNDDFNTECKNDDAMPPAAGYENVDGLYESMPDVAGERAESAEYSPLADVLTETSLPRHIYENQQ